VYKEQDRGLEIYLKFLLKQVDNKAIKYSILLFTWDKMVFHCSIIGDLVTCESQQETETTVDYFHCTLARSSR
jgi:hypothetical protein